MAKRSKVKLDEEEQRLKEEEGRRKSQERFERCLACRFFEDYLNEIGEERRKCVHPKMIGAVRKQEEVCAYFARRWPKGINPVELLR